MSGNGKYYRAVPLDFLLLEMMPDQGTLGGVHWNGRAATHMRDEIIESGISAGDLPMSVLQSRLRSMSAAGLIKNYRAVGIGGRFIWAKTPKGAEFLTTKEEVLS